MLVDFGETWFQMHCAFKINTAGFIVQVIQGHWKRHKLEYYIWFLSTPFWISECRLKNYWWCPTQLVHLKNLHWKYFSGGTKSVVGVCVLIWLL